MIKNQSIVLRWLQKNCSASGVIRRSTSEIAEEFGWSQPYATKILSSLVDEGLIVVLQKGTGHRASKYRVLTSSHNSFSHNQKPPTPLGVGNTQNKRASVFGSARTRIVESDEPLLFPQSRRVNREGPMKKFRKIWDQASKWGPTDIVCYYRWLYHTRFGVMPAVDWTICCGTARALMKRLGGPKSVKRYLQIAFSVITYKPQGLNSVYHSTTYEKVVQHWGDDEDLWDDYIDDYVFPWLRQELSRKADVMYREYQQKLWDAAQSPRHQRVIHQRRLEKINARSLLHMKENWHLYSELAH
jgi:hypothetical protein